MAHDPRHSMLIEWSDDDDAYVVSFPEWEEEQDLIGHTHGATYEEAARKGAEVLALLVQSARADGDPPPTRSRFAARLSLTAAQ